MLKFNLVTIVGGGLMLAAMWALDHMRGENELLALQVSQLERAARDDAAIIDQQAAALVNQQAIIGELGKIGMATAELRALLDLQADQLAEGLEELKRNDATVREYLRGPVPAAVGVRHARPETTDVAAYRAAAAGVSESGALPAAGPSASDSE